MKHLWNAKGLVLGAVFTFATCLAVAVAAAPAAAPAVSPADKPADAAKPAAKKGAAKAADETLTGVIAKQTSKKGIVTVELKQEDGKIVYVEMDKKGKELATHDGKKVEVTGTVKQKDRKSVV